MSKKILLVLFDSMKRNSQNINSAHMKHVQEIVPLARPLYIMVFYILTPILNNNKKISFCNY